MSAAAGFVGLCIESPLIGPAAANFLPTEWPVPPDFPVCLDAHGIVVSRVGDSIWDITLWAGKTVRLNFGDGPPGRGPTISKGNADVFRQIAAWWLWGPNPSQSPDDLRSRHDLLRPLFALCTAEGIDATDLSRFPRVSTQLAKSIASSGANQTLSLLHDLWDRREELGFVLMDAASLRDFAAAIPKHEKKQTPYIPPRIWLYQVNRLREFLEDFEAHKDELEECYRFCLDAYARNAGSLAAACRTALASRAPFNTSNQRLTGARTGCAFHGPFELTAAKYGIDRLLAKWVSPGKTSSPVGIVSLSSYFTLVGYVGLAYLLNFSLMRIEEGWSLMSDCLLIERDPVDEDIYMLRGPTTKTIADDDARWIASPSVSLAIDAMKRVSRLRMIVAEADPRVPFSAHDLANPHLVTRPYEPWTAQAGEIGQPASIRPQWTNYRQIVALYPKLFDPEQLRIREKDLQIARLLTPTLDPKEYDVGKIWPFAWHQLRRTGAVNMSASGVVGDASVQYQLKHATRAMTRYYGQGHYHLSQRLNQEARGEFIREMYEAIARDFAALSSDRFVSPYGPEHKAQILDLVTERTHKGLIAEAKKGKVAYREHLLGGCTNPDACDKGGVDSVAACGGNGKPCEHLLYDKEKLPEYRTLGRVIAARLVDAVPSSYRHESLQAQAVAIEGAINACAKA